MNTSSKPPKDTAPQFTEASENTLATFATLMHRSVERLASLQKATLDTFASYTADLNKTIRESVKPAPPTVVQSVFDLTEHSVQGWVDAQKAIVDLIAGQTAHVADAMRNRALFSKPVDVLTDLVQESAERTVEAQKMVLDYAASQNKAVSDVVRKQAGATAKPVVAAAESLEKGIDQAIETQKEILETGAKLLKRA
ncbi:MAG: hypothetical protein JO061_22140 [Acidobacteriaceae bacterium]|nr:hypothetical protein [Acidobacteriaceae bacterium]